MKNSFKLEFDSKYYETLIENTIVVKYEGEEWRAEILKNEPKQVKAGFEYTIRLLHKIEAHAE